MIRSVIARFILFFDVRFRFIDDRYIESLRNLQNTSKLKRTDFRAKKTYVGISDSRKYYALYLFWKGVPPHPKFLTVKKLPKNFSLKMQIAYSLVILVQRVLRWVSSTQVSINNFENNGIINLNSLKQGKQIGPADIPDSSSISNKISIIIPVYNAYEYFTSCLNSVFLTTDKIEIIIVDDASTDSRIIKYLDELQHEKRIKLIRNSSNLGFVKSANRGFAEAQDNDVILLNSDTIVFAGWLNGFIAWLNAGSTIATITAMSNAATIYSVPFEEEFDCEPEITKTISQEFSKTLTDFSNPLEVPTCHGFCVLITRSSLRVLNGFDENTFGRGYGEENDYSMRAKKAGFSNILATNVVVHHYGNKSFQNDRKILSQINTEKLLAIHPTFSLEISNFLSFKKLDQIRLMAIRAIQKNGIMQISTHMTHSLGGGVKKSIELETENCDSILLLIEPTFENGIKLYFKFKELRFSTEIYSETFENFFKIFFDYFEIQNVIVQHLYGYSEALVNSFHNSRVKYELRIHDYTYLCPRIHLVGQNNVDCNLPATNLCNACLRRDLPYDIETYRLSQSLLLRSAENITAPSIDSIKRYKSVYQDLNISKRVFDLELPESFSDAKTSNQGIIVAIPGELTKAKGFDMVNDLILAAEGLPIKFEILGNLGYGLRIVSKNVKVHGKYENFEQFAERVKTVTPDLFLFPGRIPETYSYTLSEALSFKIPIAYFQTGAIHERLNDNILAIPFPIDASAQMIIQGIFERFQLQK